MTLRRIEAAIETEYEKAGADVSVIHAEIDKILLKLRDERALGLFDFIALEMYNADCFCNARN